MLFTRDVFISAFILQECLCDCKIDRCHNYENENLPQKNRNFTAKFKQYSQENFNSVQEFVKVKS